jgi:hypothetical protein
MSTMKMQVKETQKDQGLAQIYQSMSLKMALLEKTGDKSFNKITSFCVCRDFLNDVYSFALAKKDFGIYGFSFPSGSKQPDWTGMHLLLQFPNDAAHATFEKNLVYIHEVEKRNKVPLTQVYESDFNGCYVVVGDKFWLSNALTFSLYTFLLRSACYKVGNVKDALEWLASVAKQDTSDAKYAASIAPDTWKKVLNDMSLIKTDEFCGFDVKTAGTGTIHHNSGFISVFGWHSEISPNTVKQNKHWQIMQERGLKTKVA